MWEQDTLKQALRIGLPVGLDRLVTSSAYVAFTRIVSPLGTIAIAANSFGITAESLCYMPGYGVQSAAVTLIGQSIGAKRHDLTYRLGVLTTILGIGLMTCSGLFMYFGSPLMMSLLSPDPSIVILGVQILQIEAFAEPMYGASIVVAGVLQGAGDTLSSSLMNSYQYVVCSYSFSCFIGRKLWSYGCLVCDGLGIKCCVEFYFCIDCLKRNGCQSWRIKKEACELLYLFSLVFS